MESTTHVEMRVLERPGEIQAAVDIFTEVWAEKIPHVPEIRATVMSGGYCAVALLGVEPVGAVWSFVGLDAAGPFHHSHMAAVRPAFQGRGIGEAIKRAQAAWCLEHGFARIRWTFDPLMAGNARFNLNRLGAVADTYIEDCYGPLGGNLDVGALAGGEPAPSDRLEVTWHLMGAPAADGEVVSVPIPPTIGAGALSALDAIAFLREHLAPLIARGGVAVGVAECEGEPCYRVVVP
jgi:predicted GNAT superfamily acetyltransferase